MAPPPDSVLYALEEEGLAAPVLCDVEAGQPWRAVMDLGEKVWCVTKHEDRAITEVTAYNGGEPVTVVLRKLDDGGEPFLSLRLGTDALYLWTADGTKKPGPLGLSLA